MGSLPQRLLPSVAEAVISNLEMELGQDYGSWSSPDLLDNNNIGVSWLGSRAWRAGTDHSCNPWKRCANFQLTLTSWISPPFQTHCWDWWVMPHKVSSHNDSLNTHSVVTWTEGQELQMSGREYRDHVVTQLLHIPWAKALLTRMASIIRELSLDLTQVEDLLKKLLVHMEEVEPQALLFLVYQLFLASHGHKRIVVTGIMSFFSKLQGWTLCGLPPGKKSPQTGRICL